MQSFVRAQGFEVSRSGVVAQVVMTAMLAMFAGSALAVELVPRRTLPKPSRERLAQDLVTQNATLKLVEGSGVRIRNGHFVVDPKRVSGRLLRSGLDAAALSRAIAELHAICARKHIQARPLFSRPEADLDAERDEGEKRSRRELADLNLHYLLEFRAADDDMIDALVELNAMAIVERVVPLAVPILAADKPPATPLLVGSQGYVGAAPDGIGSDSISGVLGGLGGDVMIVDVELGWTYTHEDLPSLTAPARDNRNLNLGFDRSHGTATIGVLVAADNGYGISGIARDATLRMVGASHNGVINVADAISYASAITSTGDVILLEFVVACFFSRDCPVEYDDQATYDAIAAASSNGRIVIEPAGNSGLPLDDTSLFGSPSQFDPAYRDSGAIMVGGGTKTVPHSVLTNCGSRVNVQGWGEGVMTLGYGNYWPGDNSDPEQSYTATFGGSSAASAIVAGAVAVLQGVQKAREQAPLTAAEMRSVLVIGATPQDPANLCNIGPLPNLANAVAAIPLPAPVGVNAAGTATAVTIRWSNVAGASAYDVYRRTTVNAPWTLVCSVSATECADPNVSAGNTYAYKVQARDGLGNRSEDSTLDIATSITYTDALLVAHSTSISATHIVEVRRATNAICTYAGVSLCPAMPFSAGATTVAQVQGQPVRASDLADVQNHIASLRALIGVSAAVFSETPVTGAAIKKLHLAEARAAAN